jgi:hypothetical protein
MGQVASGANINATLPTFLSPAQCARSSVNMKAILTRRRLTIETTAIKATDPTPRAATFRHLKGVWFSLCIRPSEGSIARIPTTNACSCFGARVQLTRAQLARSYLGLHVLNHTHPALHTRGPYQHVIVCFMQTPQPSCKLLEIT